MDGNDFLPERATHTSSCLRIGAVSVDPELGEIAASGRRVRLERRLMSLLVELAARDGRPATREDLLSKVWGDGRGADEALTLAISRLRRALGPNAHIIETIPKVGYRIAAPVRVADGNAQELLASALRHNRPWLFPAMVALSFLMGAYAALWVHL
jgi:DNA-binding winged helix-turn-helix (wHTH) protein